MHQHLNRKSAGASGWSLWLFALMAVVGLGRASVADLTKQQQENIKDGVVLIAEKGFSKGHGSGLVVHYPYGSKNSIYVITNQHVIKGVKLDKMYLHIHPKWLRNDKEIPVKRFILQDSKTDLALLEVEKKYLKSVPPERTINSHASLAPDTPVTHFGFPKNRTLDVAHPYAVKQAIAVTRGRILYSDYRQYANKKVRDSALTPQQFYITAPGVTEGGSGGGVFNDQGSWIGIEAAGGTIAQGKLKGQIYDIVIRPSIIAKFLQQKPATKSPQSKSNLTVKKVYVSNITTSEAAYDPGYIKHGNIHIVYSDGNDVQVTTDGNCSKPQISSDHKTVGWRHGKFLEYRNLKNILAGRGPKETMFYWELSLAFYKNQRISSTYGPFENTSIIRIWKFQSGSDRIAVKRFGMHGQPTYQLWDINSGKSVSTWEEWDVRAPDGKRQTPPLWVKGLPMGLDY